jgi:hypothetical protein
MKNQKKAATFCSANLLSRTIVSDSSNSSDELQFSTIGIRAVA